MKIFFCCLLIAVSCSLSFAEDNEASVTKSENVEGFTMGIMDKGGVGKAAISGTTAQILENGIIEFSDVVVRIYGEGGSSDTIVHTKKGIYNKAQNYVATDQFVRIDRQGMVVTGTGIKWYPTFLRIILEKDVNVEYSSEGFESAVSETPSENIDIDRKTLISSKGSCELDYNKNEIVFKKGVMVRDPNAFMRARTIKVFFDKDTKKLLRVEAYGGVSIQQPKRKSKSKKAVYFADEDRIVLTGRPTILQGMDSYTAEKITIYNKGERVVFEPKAELIIYGTSQN